MKTYSIYTKPTKEINSFQLRFLRVTGTAKRLNEPYFGDGAENIIYLLLGAVNPYASQSKFYLELHPNQCTDEQWFSLQNQVQIEADCRLNLHTTAVSAVDKKALNWVYKPTS